MNNAIDIFEGSKFYSRFAKSFYTPKEGLKLRKTGTNISEAIFYHLCQFRIAEWKLRVYFNRMIKQQSSDYFQNLMAFYLRTTLPGNHEVILESKPPDGNLKVDIIIKRADRYIFAIEVKTSIGWNRIREKKHKEDEQKYNDRISEIAKSFKIDKKNIIYIFETPRNTNKFFEEKFWNNNSPVARSKKSPYSKIFPLFYYGADPYYWEEYKDIDKDNKLPQITGANILKKVNRNIITPFEEIICRIINTK